MYLIAERLRRPMRRTYGGKWISFGFLILPGIGVANAVMGGRNAITILFVLGFSILMIITAIKQLIDVSRRRKRTKNNDRVFTGSWF